MARGKAAIFCATIMSSTRPHLSPQEKSLLKYLEADSRRTLSLAADHPWLTSITRNPEQLLSRLTQKQVAHRLQRGRYWVNTDGRATRYLGRLWELESLAPCLLGQIDCDWYISWHSALWHYGLIDQQSRQLVVAASTRKRNAEIGPHRVRFVTLKPERFYGYHTEETADGAQVQMADLEKALLDSFREPRLVGPCSVVAGALITAWGSGELDPERLVSYAIRSRNHSLIRRVGFWMEHLSMPHASDLLTHIGPEPACVTLLPGWKGLTDSVTAPSANRRWRVLEDKVLIDIAENPS